MSQPHLYCLLCYYGVTVDDWSGSRILNGSGRLAAKSLLCLSENLSKSTTILCLSHLIYYIFELDIIFYMISWI